MVTMTVKQETIPKDWNIKKIGQFSNATSGGTPSTLVSEYWGGDLLWMNSGELNKKKIYDVKGRITKKGLIESSTVQIPKKSVLIGLAGQGKTRGTVAINFVKLCINQSIAAVLPNYNFVPEFLYYHLDNRYKELRSLSTGASGRGGLNLGIIKNILVALPPTKKEQYAIAEVLSDTDNLINNLETLIEKKKNIKKGAMQELLTGKERLKGFNEKWETVELGNLMGIFTGNSKSKFIVTDGKYLIMDMGSVSSEGKNISQKYTNYEDDFLQLGDLIMPKDDIGGGNIIGKTAFIDKNEKYILGDHVYALRKKSIKIDPLFISYLINSYSINHEIRMKVTGTAQLGINKKSIKEQMIKIPSDIAEQKAIAQILSDMDSEIDQLEKKLSKYKMIKRGMMQKLLTGEIRLQ